MDTRDHQKEKQVSSKSNQIDSHGHHKSAMTEWHTNNTPKAGQGWRVLSDFSFWGVVFIISSEADCR